MKKTQETAKHTPGPLLLKYPTGKEITVDLLVERLGISIFHAKGIVHAIVTAPELLDALKDALFACKAGIQIPQEAISMYEAAIAKAEGRA